MIRLYSERLSAKELINIKHLLQDNKLINIQCSDFDIQDIFAGYINRNFKLSNKHTSVLLKIFSQSAVLPIKRRDIFKLQRELAAIGLSPEPLFLSVDEKIYVEQWVDGLQVKRSCNEADFSDELASTLYTIHSTEIVAPSLALVSNWDSYWQQVKQKNAVLTTQFNTLKAELVDYVERTKDESVLCHNDLHIQHICSNSGRVIDWEYAAYGCRYLDIANCAVINQLKPEQIRILCLKYASISKQDEQAVWQNVQNMLKFVAFTNKLWSISVGL